jgi:hypothetical protein
MAMEQTVQIALFLDNFKVKLGIWGVIFRNDRQKNTQTLADLEISVNDVKEVLADLAIEDYSEGPLPEIFYGGSEMWVFGKLVKRHEIYIKITLGLPGNPTICISFHVAEFPMTYPLRV